MLVSDEQIRQLSEEWDILQYKEEAISLAVEVRDIYEKRFLELKKLLDKAEEQLGELKEKR